MDREISSASSEETQAIGQIIADNLAGINLILLQGQLGAGKTVFVKGLLKGLKSKEIVTSPTYTIIRQYNLSNNPLFDNVYHIDLYRLESAEEILSLGIDELFQNKKSLIVIEWAEKWPNPTPQALNINIDMQANGSRRVIMNTNTRLVNLKDAVKIISQGAVAIYPTDTAWGIGCRIDNQASVRRVFAIRQRPLNQAMPILVADRKMAQNYFLQPIPQAIYKLTEKYWPGGLTIIYFKNKSTVHDIVTAGKNTVALRVPNHQTTLALISAVGKPILGPSANFHGEQTPFRRTDLNPLLVRKVDLVVEGESYGNQASTIVDCTSEKFTIIRQGSVKLKI